MPDVELDEEAIRVSAGKLGVSENEVRTHVWHYAEFIVEREEAAEEAKRKAEEEEAKRKAEEKEKHPRSRTTKGSE